MGANEKVKKEKMANIVREIKKHSLNILGLSEVKWKKSVDSYFEDIVLSALIEEEKSME